MKKLLLLIAMLCCLQANAAKRGDVNGDNNVDVSDINIVINEILGKGGTYNADVNGDGTTDVSDINIVINIILGKDEPEDNHEYVDLGLPSGTLWATCNIGATKPEECGQYFAWGDTKGYAKGVQHRFDPEHYLWCKGTTTSMTKYVTHPSYGDFVDKLTTLLPEDDAATVNWGKDWCMPTNDQLNEVYNTKYVTLRKTTINGVAGMKITSDSNGNSIFLPFAGYRVYEPVNGYTDEYDVKLEGRALYIWSNQIHYGMPNTAYRLSYYDFFLLDAYPREYGFSIRPVRVKAK